MSNRPHKYRAQRCEVDGISFASKAEARRYGHLKILERAGQIERLELQPRYSLTVKGEKIGEYRADFKYLQGLDWIIEDVKGVETPLFKWKRKHFEAQYPGLELRVIK